MGKFRGTLKLPCGVPDEIGEYGVQSTQYAVAQCKGGEHLWEARRNLEGSSRPGRGWGDAQCRVPGKQLHSAKGMSIYGAGALGPTTDPPCPPLTKGGRVL